MARIGFQMIMLKAHTDFAKALQVAADIGYEIAEPWGWQPPVPCVEQHRLAEVAGLQICSAHYQPGSEWVEPFVDELADLLVASKARAWVMPGGFGGKTVDEMIVSAGKLQTFYNESLAPRGLGVEYHNHSTDIAPMFHGKTQVDLLLEHTPSLSFQPDIGNAFLGGQTDSVAFLEHYKGRIGCLHVKDVRGNHMDLEHGKGSCASGEGIVDIKGSVELAKSIGVQDFIIEQEGVEGDSEIESVLRRSFEFLTPLL